MRAAKVDDNQRQIVAALLSAGCRVTLLHRVGGGVPDLLVGTPSRRFILLEVKDGAKSPSRRELTPDQVRWHDQHAGFPVHVVTSAEAALRAVAEN